MARENYYKDFVPKSCMLPKTVLEYRTPESLKLPTKELAELCQILQLEARGLRGFGIDKELDA